jgi:4-alpha-glucanotransferase
MSSVAKTAIIPMQDILNLPSDYRMNIPSTITNNWKWRMLDSQITLEITAKIAEMTQIFFRV